MKKAKIAIVAIAIIVILIVMVVASGLSPSSPVVSNSDRLASIPASATKVTTAQDVFKPVLHSNLWDNPVPMAGPINTAGAEDSPFITSDGKWFFFFFTPDVEVPVQDQLTDGVSGLWWMKLTGNNWSSPEKIILSDDVSYEGAEFVLGNQMWFASIRAGNYKEIDYYIADYSNGRWTNVRNAGEQLNLDYDIGEMHITQDGSTLFFHKGNMSSPSGMDIYYCKKSGSMWSDPVSCNINTVGMEGYPFITADGNELWYTGLSTLGYTGPAIFRCLKTGEDLWGAPQEIVSNYAGECTMDSAGNLYFVHHYYDSGFNMIEADIYVAYRA